MFVLFFSVAESASSSPPQRKFPNVPVERWGKNENVVLFKLLKRRGGMLVLKDGPTHGCQRVTCVPVCTGFCHSTRILTFSSIRRCLAGEIDAACL